ELSEDEGKDAEASIQKLTDKYIKEVDDAIDSKTDEVMTV
ncbi:MAG: ribosome recycling factor, partial [Eubacterium sp.]|nr:ribosome recycling factor [Eubacterium sp.]